MMRGLDDIENVLDKNIPTTSFERKKDYNTVGIFVGKYGVN
jgi:hypothetical protein